MLSVVTLVFLTLFLLIGLPGFKTSGLALLPAGEGVAAAAVMAIVILVYQQVENYVIQPLVYRRAVELSGFATIAVVMAGGALLGVIGAILAVPVAASLKVVLRELTAPRRERLSARPDTRAPAV
jgi:predicted PurR-regulated permease PerM